MKKNNPYDATVWLKDEAGDSVLKVEKAADSQIKLSMLPASGQFEKLTIGTLDRIKLCYSILRGKDVQWDDTCRAITISRSGSIELGKFLIAGTATSVDTQPKKKKATSTKSTWTSTIRTTKPANQ